MKTSPCMTFHVWFIALQRKEILFFLIQNGNRREINFSPVWVPLDAILRPELEPILEANS